MQIALHISGADPITEQFVGWLMVTAMLFGAFHIGQLSADLTAAVVVWSRNRWGW